MKRLLMAALATAAFTAPLALAGEAAAQNRDREYRDRDHHDRGRGRDYDDRGRGRDYRDDRGDDRRGYHDDRRDRRHWDRRRHNGYWYDGRWYYGPAPNHWRDHVHYDYRAWRRGDRLPRYYRDRYREVDWRYNRLRPPPRGYHYVYDDDREEYLLVGIATGVILGVILSGN